MSQAPAPVIHQWISTPCDASLERQINGLAELPDVVHIAVMPDVHEGKLVPNGVAVATEHLVYPELVGADIGCGISAIQFHETADRFHQSQLQELLQHLVRAIPTLKQSASVADRHHGTIEQLGTLSSQRLLQQSERDGRYQMGTLGRGNHFLELSKDSDARLWAVVHTGSRAMGQHITAYHSNIAKANGDSCLPSLDTRQPEGQAYLSDMRWACNYATANRQAILNTLADVLESRFGVEIEESSFIDSPHNLAIDQQHQGRSLIVHRKSANIATEGRQSLIAGSMLAGTKIVVGLGHPDSLESSAHGAGRVMSRKLASQEITARQMTQSLKSVVWHESHAKRLVDESPRAYRDLHEVMAHQRELVKTVDTLLPLLNDKRV